MVPVHTLNDGNEIPAVGFGTYPLRGQECVDAVLSAVEAGYRLLDTAVTYGNEEAVGEAVRRSGVPREELFVTSKLPGRDHGYDDAVRSTRAMASPNWGAIGITVMFGSSLPFCSGTESVTTISRASSSSSRSTAGPPKIGW